MWIGAAIMKNSMEALKTELPYDPAIPSLDIYIASKMKRSPHNDICIPMLKEALFTEKRFMCSQFQRC
jgi:hypothetical protein